MIAPPAWAARSLALRHVREADVSFLRQLYGQTRADELAHVPWPRAMLDRFLDDQFALQHKHYVTHYATAQFLIIESAGQPVGRLYVHQDNQDHHIVDISIATDHQGKGWGRELIAHLQALASQEGHGVSLHVSIYNPRARSLYERLGFQATAEEGAYVAMRWV